MELQGAPRRHGRRCAMHVDDAPHRMLPVAPSKAAEGSRTAPSLLHGG